MATIGNIILFVLGLSLLIFIHEFGHFLFAKLFKVYCLEFSIGMGPSIISKKFKKDEETTYSIRALPIGGYVSMAGETLDSAENEKELEIPYQRTINGINPWKRALITIAGVTFNFIFALILLGIYIFANGVSTNDNSVIIVNDSIAQDYGLSTGDKILFVKDVRVKSGSDIIYSDCTDENDRCEVIYFSGFNTYLNNELLLEKTKDYHEAHPNAEIIQEITIIYSHRGSTGEITTPLQRTFDNEKDAFPLLGINEARTTPDFFQGIGLIFKTFGQIIVLMGGAIISLFSPEGFNSLGGVVSMYQTSATMASEGILSYIWYLAIISINLGFFNLLPIPALDGARFYISLAEGVSRKKLNPKIEGYLNLFGMILLFGLMIAVTVKDIIMLF
ncbi:MAG: site-2 protease family protein [Bacilli bacterium]|nr:site-2 protease family protein [Bacilli bacterium]